MAKSKTKKKKVLPPKKKAVKIRPIHDEPSSAELSKNEKETPAKDEGAGVPPAPQKTDVPTAASADAGGAAGTRAGGGSGDNTDKKNLRPKPSKDISMSSFNEIVGLNDEGHTYINLNRLVYQPKDNGGAVFEPEKTRWWDYVPDFCFIILNLVSIAISIYFLLMGSSALQWRASMKMFNIPSCADVLSVDKNRQEFDKDPMTQDRIMESFYYLPCKFFMESRRKVFRSHDWKKDNSFPIYKTLAAQPEQLGAILMIVVLLNFFNVMFGISACLKGYKPILIQHVILDPLLILAELIVCVLFTTTGACSEGDLEVVRVLLAHYIRWYGITAHRPEHQTDKERLLNGQVDALQIGLDCCGVDGWGDYLPGGYPYYNYPLETSQLDGEEGVIPFSCCRRWWLRNIYCAHGAHVWARPDASPEDANRFHERIIEDGCIYKLEEFCKIMLKADGVNGLFVVLFHLIVFILEATAVYILAKNIERMIRRQKKAMKSKELMHEPDGSGSELDIPEEEGGGRGKNPWAKVAPPTEDEVYTIKERSNFNNFVAALKHDQVGRWMEEGRAVVTEGQEDEFQFEEQPAEAAHQKKAKDKALLHGNKKLDGLQAKEHKHVKAIGLKQAEKMDQADEELEEEPKPKRRKRKKRKKRPTPVGERTPWWGYFGGLP